MRNAIFVAGTDTGVGKTVVTGLVAKYLAGEGYKVATQKWVETGVTKSKAVFAFKLPASPHLAAKSEGKTINIAKIKNDLKKLSRKADIVVIEGTGGLMVPLTEKILLIDVVKKLKIPVLLVCANRLGAINHALLSLEALKARKMKVLGVVFNHISKKENRSILKDNPGIVKKFAKKVPVWINGWKKT
ncbi:MAG: dethiobiotin synthase [Candidatus Omnitrophica bacterium]|nr:dethiobiotin synthase [Candidatus Omnitrophota bacterium]